MAKVLLTADVLLLDTLGGLVLASKLVIFGPLLISGTGCNVC